MSRDIIMQEDGVEKTLEDLSKLKTESDTGTNQEWALVEDSQICDIELHANGEYKAEDYDRAGFGVVTVNNKKGGGPKVLRSYTPDNPKDIVIAIEEGGKKRLLTAKKIETNVSNGTVKWIPEHSFADKSISANGIYHAKNDRAAGYKTVSVNIPAGGGGGGGEDELPVGIRILTLPDKTTYEEIDTIDYTGMVVQAYNGKGEAWENSEYPNGIIPFDELILDMNSIDIRYMPRTSNIIDVLRPYLTVPREVYPSDVIEYFHIHDTGEPFFERDESYIKVYNAASNEIKLLLLMTEKDGDKGSNENSYILQATKTPPDGSTTRTYNDAIWKEYYYDGPQTGRVISEGERYGTGYLDWFNYKSFTYRNKKVYYTSATNGVPWGNPAVSDRLFNYYAQPPLYIDKPYIATGFTFGGVDEKYILDVLAWTMIYGDFFVPVKWIRPYDGKELETKYEIIIE